MRRLIDGPTCGIQRLRAVGRLGDRSVRIEQGDASTHELACGVVRLEDVRRVRGALRSVPRSSVAQCSRLEVNSMAVVRSAVVPKWVVALRCRVRPKVA